MNRTKKTQKVATAEDFMPDTFSVKQKAGTQDIGEQVSRAFKEIELFSRKPRVNG